MVKVRSLEGVPFSSYICLYNVLRICNTRAIPTYRVYRLYDSIPLNKVLGELTMSVFITLCLEYRQNYVQNDIGICRQGAGLGFRKNTPFYMGLPVL